MYGCDYNDAGSSLYAINSTTGETTLIGPMYLYGCLGLTFNNGGELFAYGYTPEEALGIFSVDVSTGAATLIADVSSPSSSCPNWNILGFASNPSDGMLYATFSNCLVTIDPETGAVTEIGTTDYGTYYGNALAFGPSALYSAGGYPSLTLYTLDPTTASIMYDVAITGAPWPDCSMATLAFNEGELYGVAYCGGGSEYFVSINTNTGAMTVIGQPSEALVAIAAGPYCNLSSGTCSATYTPAPSPLVYGCVTPEESSSLYAIDPTTGEATLIGPMGMNYCTGLVFSASGTLYAFGDDENFNQGLFTVNTTTGAATLIGDTWVSEEYSCLTYGDALGLALNPTDGTLYAAIDNCILTLNPSSGAPTVIGSTDFSDTDDNGSALAFSPSSTLYAASDGLYTVDPETAEDSRVAQFSGYPPGCTASESLVTGLSFNGKTLYGVLECWGEEENYLVTINTSTAAMTVIGQTAAWLYAIAWLPSCALSTSSCSTVPTPPLTTITAHYQGDSNYAPSSGTFVLNGVISPVTVLCSPSSVGASVATTCTASVKGHSPTGTVTFSSSSSTGSFVPSNGECALSSGACHVSYSDTTGGSVNITAKYGGDSNNKPSSGSFIETIVVITPTSTGVICSPSPVVAGSPTQCTATVTGSSPSGLVSWSSSGSGSFDSYSCELSSGACSVNYTSTTAKSPVNITAIYKGDSKNGQSNGIFSLGVSKITTTTSLSCSPSTVEMNATTTCTASVPSSITPTGKVSFATSSSNGGAVTPSSASCTLSGGACSVTFKGSPDHGGAVKVAATYPGDSNNLGSSNTFSLSVVKNPTTTDVSCVPSSLNPTDSTTCTATVSFSTNIPGFPGPYATAYDPENGYIYVANSGGPWAGGWADTVSVLDGASGALVTTVFAGPQPEGVAYDPKNGLIYVSDGGAGSGDTVALINASTNTFVQYVTVGDTPYGIAYDPANGYVYVANYWSDTISVIDGNVSLGFIPLKCQVVTGCGPAGLAYDSKNGYIYVANQRSSPGTISVIDTSNNSLIATIGFNDESLSATTSIAIDPINGYIYAAGDGGVMFVVSPASTEFKTIVQYVNPGSGLGTLRGVAFDSNNGNIYATTSDSAGDVIVIDGTTNSLIGTVEAAVGAQGIAIDNSNGNIFVANWINDSVTMIESTTLAQGETITFSQSGGTGSVSFGSTTCALSSEGACSVSVTALTIGSATIEASYAGDSNFGFSSGTFSLTIASKSSTSVVCAPSPVDSGSATTCTATVTGTSPTGTVSWSTSGQGEFSSTTCSLSSGSCSVKYTPSSSDSPVTIKGSYGGDSSNTASSGTFSLEVSKAITTTTSSSSSSSSSTTTTTTSSSAPTCGCTKKGPFQNPSVSAPSPATFIAPSSFYSPDGKLTVNITSIPPYQYLSVTNGSDTIVSGILNPLAWGWSSNSHYFLVAYRAPTWSDDTLALAVYNVYGKTPSTPTISETITYDTGASAGSLSGNKTGMGTYGAAAWGFSPDGSTFLLKYVQGGNVYLDVWSSVNGKSLGIGSPLMPNTLVAAVIQFSPCSDLLMIIEQNAVSGPILGQVTFYSTSSGQTVVTPPQLVSLPAKATVALVGAKYVVQLKGMSLSSFSSSQCTDATIKGDAPFTLLVTDSLGRSVGYNSTAESEVLDIPNSTYSGQYSDPQVVTIPDPSGNYMIALTGRGSGGSYTFTETFSDNGTVLQTLSSTGTIGSAQVISSEYRAPELLVVESTGALSASSVPISALAGVGFSGRVAAFNDSDGNTNATKYTAMIDWGDGAKSAGVVTLGSGGTFIVSGQHTYSSEGVEVVSVQVNDSDGNTATVTGLASVASAATTTTAVPLGTPEFSASVTITLIVAISLLAVALLRRSLRPATKAHVDR